MPNKVYEGDKNTIDSCISKCASQNFLFAGVQHRFVKIILFYKSLKICTY
jgi:hypothetical protein